MKRFLLVFTIILSYLNLDKVYSADLDSSDIVNKILERDKKNKVFQAVISTYSKGYLKNGKKQNSLIESKISGKVTMRKPNTVLFKVLESDDPMARGSTLLYTGGKTVKVKASGLFGFMSFNFNADDPMFTNSRGHKFTFDGLKEIRNPNAKVEVIGESKINNRDMYLLKVISPVKADPEITHEIYKVDKETFVVHSIRMYVNKDMVSEYSLKELKTDIEDSDDLFKI